MSDDFLDFLVSETFKLQEQGSDRLRNFESKINDYRLFYLKGEFLASLKIFRFQTKLGLIDAPMTWSVFNITEENSNYLIYDHHSDSEKILEVISKSIGIDFSKLLITQSEGYFYLLFFKKSEESYIPYFLTTEVEIDQAA